MSNALSIVREQLLMVKNVSDEDDVTLVAVSKQRR